MGIVFPPYLPALLAAFAITSTVAVIGWSRRYTPGRRAFVALMTSVSVWLAFRMAEGVAADVNDKIMWARWEYFGIVAVPVCWFVFAWQFAQRRPALSRPVLIGLGIEPLLTVVMAFTNDHHRLLWSHILPASSEPGVNLVYQHGIWFWFSTFYNYLLAMAGAFTLIINAAGLSRLYRAQTVSLLLSVAIVLGANLIYITGLSPFPGLDLTPFAFAATGPIFLYSLSRFRLFEMTPIAWHQVLGSMNEGIVLVDRKACIVEINDAARRLLGVADVTVAGREARAVLKSWPELHALIGAGAGRTVEMQRPERAGNGGGASDEDVTRIIDAHETPLVDGSGQFNGTLIVLRDMTAERRAEHGLRAANARLVAQADAMQALQRKLEEQVARDPLTGLHNRRQLRRYLDDTFGVDDGSVSATPVAIPALAMVMIDVDHFKRYNDSHGHLAGDAVLAAVAEVLGGAVGEGEIACRFGGEEFLMVLRESTAQAALARVEALRAAVARHCVRVLSGRQETLSVSAGIALAPVHGQTPNAVIHCADAALYRAKADGRDCTRLYQAEP